MPSVGRLSTRVEIGDDGRIFSAWVLKKNGSVTDTRDTRRDEGPYISDLINLKLRLVINISFDQGIAIERW